MKLERKFRRSTRELILEITPLIDVVFLLLIFFLVATTFEDFSTGIKIDLPQSSVKEINEVTGLQLVVANNKEVIIVYKQGGKNMQVKVSRDKLKQELENRLADSKDKNVLISADKKLDYGFVVDLMSISREAGATSLDMDTADKN